MAMRLEKPSRVQSAATIALTALFLCAIGFFGFKGVAKDPKAVLNAVRFHKAKRYLANEAQTDFFSMTQARILSLQDQLERAVPYQDELHVLNASFQYALGREMVVEGAEQMLRLPNRRHPLRLQAPPQAAAPQRDLSTAVRRHRVTRWVKYRLTANRCRCFTPTPRLKSPFPPAGTTLLWRAAFTVMPASTASSTSAFWTFGRSTCPAATMMTSSGTR